MLHVVYALNKGLKQLWEHIEEKKPTYMLQLIFYFG